MVTWGRAFKAAFVYVLFLLGWVILGGVVLSIGIASMAAGAGGLFTIDPITGQPTVNFGTLTASVGGLITAIVGYLIIILGCIATMFKIFSEIVAEEVMSRLGYLTTSQSQEWMKS